MGLSTAQLFLLFGTVLGIMALMGACYAMGYLRGRGGAQ
jgi:hypothetical protein